MATFEEVQARAAAWEASRTSAQARNSKGRINYTARAKLRLVAGVHPVAGTPLANNNESCGSCGHLTAFERAHRHLKCDLFNTRSEATDIRRWWPACTNWKPDGD